MFAKIRILIENTPRSTAMPEGTGTFAVQRFLAYDRQMGVAKFTHHTVVVFYAIGSLFCYFIGMFTSYIFLNCTKCSTDLIRVVSCSNGLT